MKKFGIVFTGLLLSVALQAQKQINDNNAEVRQVKNFHGIKVATGIHLYLSQGDTEAVAVSAATIEDRDRIKTEVVNGILKIYYSQKAWRLFKKQGKKLKAYVSAITIDKLDISSGAYTDVEGSIKSDQLVMDVSSGAVFKGKVEVNNLVVDQSSGAVVTISGTVGKLDVEGSSGSIFRGYELVVEKCHADVSSGAGMQVTVNKELSAEASSGASVSYKGNGHTRRINTSSGGSVRRDK